MGNILFIVWRESLEAVLIIGILHSFLVRHIPSSLKRGLTFMWGGVIGGVALSALLAFATTRVQDSLSGTALDYFQAAVFLISAVLMTQMVMWMNKHGRMMKKELETDLTHAMTTSGLWGIAGVAGLAVAREGAETVVYLYGLTLEAALSPSAMIAAAGAGFGLALLSAWVVSHGVRKLHYGHFFKITSVILLLSAAGLLVTGASRLIEMDVLPSLVNPIWNTSALIDGNSKLGGLLGIFTGYRPRPSLMLVLIYSAYWIAALYLMRRTSSSTVSQYGVKKTVLAFIGIGAFFGILSPRAHAINYNELEVYGYTTAGDGEFEFESQSSVSSIFRSSMEMNYGINDRWEIAGYADFSRITKTGDDEETYAYDNSRLRYDAARAHARTHFGEKGQMPIDVGAYAEMEFPRGESSKVEAEFKAIIEKDFDRFTFDLNPAIERPMITSDDHPQMAFQYTAGAIYRLNQMWRPHLDFFGTIGGDEDGTHLVSPAVDVRIAHNMELGARAGFGLTSATESALGGVRLEYEF